MTKNLNHKLLIILLVAVLVISLVATVACDYTPDSNSGGQPNGSQENPQDKPKDEPKAEPKLTATFDATHTVYDGDSLNSLKQYLTVTYTNDNGTTSQVSNYTLIGSLNIGNNQIVVLYYHLTVILNINVVKKPTVTFVADGRTVAVMTYTKYQLWVNKPVLPSKYGYDGVWEDYTLTADSGDITVNAVYTAKTYTVTFDYNGADGNTGVQSMTVTFDQPIGTLPKPTLLDNDFLGWYYYSSSVNSGDVWSRAYDCTLVAQWNPSAFDSHGLSYLLNDDKESYAVSGFNDTLNSELTIPETHLGKPVTAIQTRAFENCSVLTSVVVPDSITEIKYYAFKDCDNLTSVSLGNGLISIGSNVFDGCVKLTGISIPASVESIGESIVSNCPNLGNITVEEGNNFYHSSGNCLIATELGWLINGCKNSVIPTDGSVTTINRYAFNGCRDLEEINIPDSVTRIEIAAFKDCVKLKSVVIPDSVRGTLYMDTFSGCTALESVTLSNNLIMTQYSFRNCISLKSITIPQSVRFIGGWTFEGCINLESIVILNREYQLGIGSNAFMDCEKLSSIYFEGTEEEWNKNMVIREDSGIANATVYFYSASAPELNADGADYDGNFWHWDQDVPTVWKKEN